MNNDQPEGKPAQRQGGVVATHRVIRFLAESLCERNAEYLGPPYPSQWQQDQVRIELRMTMTINGEPLEQTAAWEEGLNHHPAHDAKDAPVQPVDRAARARAMVGIEGADCPTCQRYIPISPATRARIAANARWGKTPSPLADPHPCGPGSDCCQYARRPAQAWVRDGHCNCGCHRAVQGMGTLD